MRTAPLLLRAAVLVAAAALAAGCPDPTDPPPDATAPPTDADTRDDGPDADTAVVLPDRCDAPADCLEAAAPPPCQRLDCVDHRCVLSDAADGAACDDGSPCTSADRCAAGVCTGDDACDDANACTTDGCDPQSGCVHTFNQRPCDDGSACTSDDRCAQGACTGVALDCDDLNPCTLDRCDPAAGCLHSDRDGACDDGNACTTGDLCEDGECEGGAPTVCGDPSNPCVSATCDATDGCVLTPLSGPCDDHNACTTDDACVAGVCTGPTRSCDDTNPCTDDYCDQALGCITTDNVAPCDDGDACTLEDRCADGACQGGAPNPLCCAPGDDAACDDGDACTTDRCGLDGLCAHPPIDCDDGSACTADLCDGGACGHVPWGPGDGQPRELATFEGPDALSAWTLASSNADVAWRLDPTAPHGGGAALYCGAVPSYSYDFGATLATASRSLAIPPGAATLSFWARLDVEENASCIYDVLRVTIDGVALTPLCASLPAWTERVYDLSAWAGRVVTLTFTFDTFDDQANDGAGAWIDDLTLSAIHDLGCCAGPGDCGGGPGCLAEHCDAGYRCLVPPAGEACDDSDPCTADSCAASGDCAHAPIAGCR